MTINNLNIDPDDFCWINQQELTQRTGFSRHKIRHWIVRGWLPAGIVRGRKRFWREADIDRALISHSLMRLRESLLRIKSEWRSDTGTGF